MRALLPQVVRLDIDLPEIQHTDPQAVITAKLQAASSHYPGRFIVEDTSLSLACLNGLPGPLTKWFLQALGNNGLFKLAHKMGDLAATASTVIGYFAGPSEIFFFSAAISGSLVAPRGKSGFGWDSIFQPGGHAKTFAQMTAQEKNQVSMRRMAVAKLKHHLMGEGPSSTQR